MLKYLSLPLALVAMPVFCQPSTANLPDGVTAGPSLVCVTPGTVSSSPLCTPQLRPAAHQNTPQTWFGTTTHWEQWNGTEPIGQTKAPSPLLVNYSYGYMSPASGTGIGVQSNVDVYAMALPAAGVNEVAAYYGFVRANNNGSQPAGQNWWTTDFIIQTPYVTVSANRPNFGVGISQHFINLSNGADIIDGTHAGMFGLSVVATPDDAASLVSTGAPGNAQSYPVSALIQAAGFGGPDTVTSGEQAGALAAGDYAFRAGGGGGSVYIGNTARSNFLVGAGLFDWSSAGLQIANALPGRTGPGILNAYDSTLGGTNLIGSAPVVTLNPNAGSYFDGILLGGTGHQWLFGTDGAADSGDDMFFYARSNSSFPLKLTPTAVIAGVPLQLGATTYAALRACDAGAAGTMAYITDASAAITVWHQPVTIGGGANKAFIACNGSGWYAFAY